MANVSSITPKPNDELQKLESLIGTWKGSGSNANTAPQLASTKLTAQEKYEWLPGKFFVTYRGWLDFGGQKLEALRTIGYDSAIKRFVMYAFDSMGFTRVYRGDRNGHTWKFTGESERVTIVVSNDGKKLKTHWEQSNDGWEWHTLCEFEEHKV